jgi:condensin complex subunit 3
LCDDWDQYQKNTFEYILLMLIEIISKYDFGDEIGRDRLKILLSKIMREIAVEEAAIKIIIQIFEELLPQTETRLEVRHMFSLLPL